MRAVEKDRPDMMEDLHNWLVTGFDTKGLNRWIDEQGGWVSTVFFFAELNLKPKSNWSVCSLSFLPFS